MFERYTEKARRVIFFGRYEASTFGSPCIETEHLLLGLLREDKSLASKFKLPADAIRKQIEQHTTPREKISTSVDLPLSHECKRVLAFGAEEAERLNHKHIHTDHLLLGMLREERSFAAELLTERGLRLPEAREEVSRRHPALRASSAPPEFEEQEWFAKLRNILLDRQAQAGITIVARPTVGSHTPDFAVFAADGVETDGQILERGGLEHTATPRQEIAAIRRRIHMIVHRMESAIAYHEFENARLLSEEERKERENLRQKLEAHNQLAEPEPAIPFLCIQLAHQQSLGDLQGQIDEYLAAGVEQVWVLSPANKKAYTATAGDGLREFRGQVLEANRLELPLAELFA